MTDEPDSVELDSVTINNKVYPSRYPPGVDPVLDEVWEIVDRLPLEDAHARAFLAGNIWGLVHRYMQKN